MIFAVAELIHCQHFYILPVIKYQCVPDDFVYLQNFNPRQKAGVQFRIVLQLEKTTVATFGISCLDSQVPLFSAFYITSAVVHSVYG